MSQAFERFWWAFAARGLAAILFGAFLFFYPGLSLGLLVVSFGLFALLQGMLAFVAGLSTPGKRVYFQLVEGTAGLVAGVLTFLGPGIGRMIWPDVATMTMLFFITIWAVLTGAAEVIGSFRLPGEIRGRRVITVSGLICLALGLILILRAGAGAVGNGRIIGLSAIGLGLLWSVVGFSGRTVLGRQGS